MMLQFLNRGAAPNTFHDGVAAQIRDAATRDVFALLGNPPSQDRKLQLMARRLLHEHLERLASGVLDPIAVLPCGFSNVSYLGTLDDLQTELAQRGSLHAWGHFITLPRAYAAAFATFTPADGAPRAYMATVWRP